VLSGLKRLHAASCSNAGHIHTHQLTLREPNDGVQVKCCLLQNVTSGDQLLALCRMQTARCGNRLAEPLVATRPVGVPHRAGSPHFGFFCNQQRPSVEPDCRSASQDIALPMLEIEVSL